MLDKKLQQEIIKKFKGKGGPPDCESSIIDSKDVKGFVDLFAVAGQRLKKRESHALVMVLCIRLTASIFVVLNIVSKY